MIWNTLVIALREIGRNKLRSLLTTLGIVIGVGAVIAMVMLGDGAAKSITDNISALGENMLVLTSGTSRHGPGGVSTESPPLELADSAAIERQINGLRWVAPTATRQMLVVFGNRNLRTPVTGTTPEYLDINNYELARGRLMNSAELDGGHAVCLLGSTTREELFGQQDPLGTSIRLGKLSCAVIGLLAEKPGSSIRDPNDVVLIPLKTFQRRIAGNRDVSAIYMSVDPQRSTALAADQVTRLMRERRRIAPGADDDFHIRDMKEILETMTSVTGVLTTLLAAIAAVSLMVGGIGIMNIMLVSVTERTREIGIRLAIGARGREVLLQFLIEAVVLATLGGIIGALVGVGAGFAAHRMLGIPLVISPETISLSLLFAGAVGVLFGYLPARKAAQLDPIEALRHE